MNDHDSNYIHRAKVPLLGGFEDLGGFWGGGFIVAVQETLAI